MNVRYASEALQNSLDATVLRRGDSRLKLINDGRVSGCHGLAPWSLTLLACGGRKWLTCGSVRLHGASPWHLKTNRVC